MNTDERICSLALTLCPGIGLMGARRLVSGMGSAVAVFQYRKELPERLPGVSASVISALDNAEAFRRAEEELAFAEKNGIACLTLNAEDYPSRLRECEDAPIALFSRERET